jgi:glycine cleavage system H protein
MSAGPSAFILYQRGQFATPLPAGFLYTPGHHWLARQPDGLWRVGLTKFATQLLGEMAEHGFRVAPGAAVTAGDVIGSLEGFKAVLELRGVVTGRFLGGNPALREKPELVNQAPYDVGWLYAAEGTPEAACLGVHGYGAFLDRTIDGMLLAAKGDAETR